MAFNCPKCGSDTPEMDIWDGEHYTFICLDCHALTVVNYDPFDQKEDEPNDQDEGPRERSRVLG